MSPSIRADPQEEDTGGFKRLRSVLARLVSRRF